MVNAAVLPHRNLCDENEARDYLEMAAGHLRRAEANPVLMFCEVQNKHVRYVDGIGDCAIPVIGPDDYRSSFSRFNYLKKRLGTGVTLSRFFEVTGIERLLHETRKHFVPEGAAIDVPEAVYIYCDHRDMADAYKHLTTRPFRVKVLLIGVDPTLEHSPNGYIEYWITPLAR